MKGIVFTEFLGFVGQRFGEDMVDDVIEDCPLSTGGAYTSVGTYDHREMVALCQALARRTGEPPQALVKDFGQHLSRSFHSGHGHFFARSGHYFDFLESVESHIHHEVRKLYPDAELPTITVVERGEHHLVLDYRSPRRLGALAQGLLEGTAAHFGVVARVRSEALDGDEGQAVRFTVEID
jgi:hypothetical protein